MNNPKISPLFWLNEKNCYNLRYADLQTYNLQIVVLNGKLWKSNSGIGDKFK